MARIQYGITLLLILSPIAQAAPCPSIHLEPKDVGKLADWIIEGRVTEVRKTGTFRDCERVPSQQPGGELYCADVDKPETIVLDGTSVVQDSKGKFGTASRLELSRMSHCFSGKLAPVMNAKPELKAIGKRVRFYGREYEAPPFVQPGYFWIEILE